jgi:tRNA pseudouridine55 synthase
MLARVFGLLNIRKPPGPTSHDIVDQVRRRTGQAKVGHAGTLDPFAEGVLVLCLGPATRLAEYVQAQPKSYVAHIALGATSDTDDPTGQIAPAQDAHALAEELVRGVLKKFVGTIEQIPPAHSAVHVAGRRAYKLARAGKDFALAARTVEVHRIDVLAYAYPALELAVSCGGGTYIRALARDIGSALGCGGYCSRLVRTAVGVFTLGQAVAPEDLDPQQDLLPAVLALGDMPRLTLDASACARLAKGQHVTLAAPQPPRPIISPAFPVELAALNEQGRLVAIGTVAQDGVTLSPTKVFPVD